MAPCSLQRVSFKCLPRRLITRCAGAELGSEGAPGGFPLGAGLPATPDSLHSIFPYCPFVQGNLVAIKLVNRKRIELTRKVLFELKHVMWAGGGGVPGRAHQSPEVALIYGGGVRDIKDGRRGSKSC